MKTVFSSAGDVIHLFAQRTQHEARSSNVFFVGNKIYSYGYHYLLGEFVTNKKGETAVIINDSGYSNTTSKHISWMSQGTRQYKQFFTRHTEPSRVLSTIREAASSFPAARKKEKYTDIAIGAWEGLLEFVQWSGNKELLKTKEAIEAKIWLSVCMGEKSFSEVSKQKEARLRREQAKARKAREKAAEIERQKFLAFEINRCYKLEKDEIRINKSTHTVETSQQSVIPIKECAILYKLIKEGSNVVGHKIGRYTVDHLNGDLKVGCHIIPMESVIRVGEQLLAL